MVRRTLALSAVWLIATTASVAVAGAAVSSVRQAVTDAPIPIGLPAPDTTLSQTAASLPEQAEVIPVVAPPATETPVTTSPAISVAPPIEELAPPPSVTAPMPAADIRSYETAGGSVTIAVGPDGVWLEGAVSNQGWQVVTEKTGPPSVDVKFKRPGEEVSFKAEIEHGELKVKIEPDN